MTKRDAFGSQLKIGDGGGPEVFTTVVHVQDISGPELTADSRDVTSHDSAGAFKEYVTGLLDSGEVTFDVFWDPDTATHVALRADLLSRVRRNFKLLWGSAPLETWDFAGQITRFAPSAPVDGMLAASITIKVTGAPTPTG